MRARAGGGADAGMTFIVKPSHGNLYIFYVKQMFYNAHRKLFYYYYFFFSNLGWCPLGVGALHKLLTPRIGSGSTARSHAFG